MTEPPSGAARDELAGIVDLFGALTREELANSLHELAFKAGADADRDALEETIDDALDAYYLVAADPAHVTVDGGDITFGGTDSADEDLDSVTNTDETLLAVGPAAFPQLPDGAEDLPHILEIEHRTVDRESLGQDVSERLAADVSAALDTDATDRLEDLLDVCYDLEAWAPVETDDLRADLTDALESE